MEFPCGECANSHASAQARCVHRILEHPSMYPFVNGGSCFFCLKRVANYFHVHDHVEKWHNVEHMFLSEMAANLNKRVASPKTRYFWLQVVFLAPTEQRPDKMSGEEIMNFLWHKMEQLAAGVNEAAQTPARINQQAVPQPATTSQAAVPQPATTTIQAAQPSTSLPQANYPMQIDLGNGVFASLAGTSGVGDAVAVASSQAPASSGQSSSSATTLPTTAALDFSLMQSMTLPQGLLPVCTSITPEMMAALMGTPIVAAGSSEEDLQRIVEQQMIGGGGGNLPAVVAQEMNRGQMAALMGTPIIPADNNNSHASLEQIVEQQMSANQPSTSSSQAYSDMPRLLPQKLSAEMMAALMGTPIDASGRANGSLEEVEQQMSGGSGIIQPQESIPIEDSNSIATPPMLFATAEDEAAEDVQIIEGNNAIQALPQEILQAIAQAAGPSQLPPNSCLAILNELAGQQIGGHSAVDDAAVFKVPKLPYKRPSRAKSAIAAKKARKEGAEPSVAEVLKRMQSSGIKLQARSSRPKPVWRRWSLSQILRTIAQVPDPNLPHAVDQAIKRDKSNSSQLAVVITSILCMRGEQFLLMAKEVELELTAAIRGGGAIPDDDAALDAQLRATKYDINLRMYDTVLSPHLVVQDTINQGWEIANVFLCCLPEQWREELHKTFELLRQTLILLMSMHQPLKEKLVKLKELLQLHIWCCIPTDPKYRAWILELRKRFYGCDAPLPAWTKHAAALVGMPDMPDLDSIPDVFLGRPRSPPSDDFPDPPMPMMAPPVSPGFLALVEALAPLSAKADEKDKSSPEEVSAMVASIKRCTKAAEEASLALGLRPSAAVSATMKAESSSKKVESPVAVAAKVVGHAVVAAPSAHSAPATSSKTSPTPATSAPTTPPDSTQSTSQSSSGLPVASTSSSGTSVPPPKMSTPAELAQVLSAFNDARQSLNGTAELRPFLPFAQACELYAEDRQCWLTKTGKVACRYGCAMMASSSGMVSHYRRYHYDVYFQAVHKAWKEMSVERWLKVRFGCEKEGKSEERRACLVCCKGPIRKPDFVDRQQLAQHLKQCHPSYFAAIRDDYLSIFKGLIEDDPIVRMLVEQ